MRTSGASKGTRAVAPAWFLFACLAGPCAASRIDCPGDCDDDGAIGSAEVQAGVDAVLERSAGGCASLDADGNGRVTVADLVRVVRAATRPACLQLDALSATHGPPGRFIALSGAGWIPGEGDLQIDFEGTPAPVFVDAAGAAGFHVPPLPPRAYAIALASGGHATAPLSFTIDAPQDLPLSQADFAVAVEDGLRALSATTRAIVDEAESWDVVGWTPAQAESLRAQLGQANLVLAAARTQFAQLPPDEAALVQSLFVESGLLDLLRDAGAPIGARVMGAHAIQERLFLGDVTSFLITNLQPILDIAEIVSVAATVASGGAATPSLIFNICVKTALSIIDGVLDVLLPTDLQSIVLRDRTFRPGQSASLSGTAYFSCQENFIGGSVSVVVGVVIDSALEFVAPPPPASVRQAIAEKVAELLVSQGVDMITDGVSDAFLGDVDHPLYENVPVPYDPVTFEGGLASYLARALPLGDFGAFLESLARWGIAPPEPTVVWVENTSLVAYDPYSGRLEGGDAAGMTRIQAWGVRFDDANLFWGTLTLAVPAAVLSNLAVVTLDPDALTEPPNIVDITPVFGFQGDAVTFSAQVTGMAPLAHEWTFGSAATPSSSTEAQPAVVLGSIRKYVASLRVTNEFGEDQQSFIVTVARRGDNPGWILVPVAGNADRSASTAPKILDSGGVPGIVFTSWSPPGLRWVRALDGQGRTWGAPVGIPAADADGAYDFGAALVDGAPAVAHLARVPGTFDSVVRFLRADDAEGTSWTAPAVAVSAQGSSGSSVVLLVVAGRPAVVYRDPASSQRLVYRRALDSTGNAWGGSAVIAEGEPIAYSVMAAVVGGTPCAAWVSGDKLRFARSLDDEGSAWEPPVTLVDWTSVTGSSVVPEGTLVDSGGRPAVSWVASAGTEDVSLWFKHGLGGDPPAWLPEMRLDAMSDARFSFTASVAGRPAIAYELAGTLTELRLLWADDAAGQRWPAPLVLDADATGRPGLAAWFARPVIAFPQESRWLVFAYVDPEEE